MGILLCTSSVREQSLLDSVTNIISPFNQAVPVDGAGYGSRANEHIDGDVNRIEGVTVEALCWSTTDFSRLSFFCFRVFHAIRYAIQPQRVREEKWVLYS